MLAPTGRFIKATKGNIIKMNWKLKYSEIHFIRVQYVSEETEFAKPAKKFDACTISDMYTFI